MAPPVPIVLAFKHPIFTIGVRSVLSARDDIHILAECSTLPGVLRALRKHQPRVLVVGVGICDGEEALQSLARASSNTRLALFWTRPDDVPQHVLLQGASAVLPPESGPEHLVECVLALAAGRRWQAPARLRAAVRGNGARKPVRGTPTVLAALSVRERQIAHAVITGKRNREIAEAFGISPGTVKLHLNRIYSKVGVSSRLELFKKLISEANLPV